MRTDLHIRLAVLDEASHIIKLLRDTAQWIQEQGINQWSYLLDGGEDEEIVRCIENNQTHVVEKNGELTATFTLYPLQNEWDQEIWGHQEENAVYLHRLAVNSAYMKQGIGNVILSWIPEAVSADWIRLDCVADNEKLNAFYRENGFEWAGATKGHSKFQKQVHKKSPLL
ncbi:GNAT family N-acetyltransferase [Metabacillus indicus]|uniref:GNAT family N-acetyltransferase n=1 Tax=Metabacillus indicus TaxID=246786 RepID=UPI003CF30BDE